MKNTEKRKFSRTGLVLVGSMLVCLLICLAVVIPRGGVGGDAVADLNDESTPDLKTVINEGSPLLIYDKRPETQALMASYDNGKLKKARIGKGFKKEVKVKDREEVQELYRLLKNVVVTEEVGRTAAAESLKGAPETKFYILTFEVQDEPECSYTLIGDSLLALGAVYDAGDVEDMDDVEYAAVSDTEPLLEQIKALRHKK